VTLLLIILSITNIAIGYWLAVHLGHARVHGAPAERVARSQPAAEQLPNESRQDKHDRAPAPAVAAEPPAEPPAEPIAPKPVMVSPVSEAVEPPAIADETLAEEVEEPSIPEVVETAEVAAEEEVLNSVESVRAEIHDHPAPATMVEALANEAESESPAAEKASSESKPVSKEALLESIGAFQEQLKKQRELSKLHPATGGEKS